MSLFDWQSIRENIKSAPRNLSENQGILTKQVGLLLEGRVKGAKLGSVVSIEGNKGKQVRAEVVGFKDQNLLLMPLDEYQGISMGATMKMEETEASVSVGPWLLGRVIDPLGNPLDNKGPLPPSAVQMPLYAEPINPVSRVPIRERMSLGIRAIDGLMACGRGQRIGIMAGSGVGKSVLMGMISKNTEAEVNVIALVGERGREVLEFIEKDLGPEGLARSIVIVATSDMSPVTRKRAGFFAMAIAEYFRDLGKDVLYLMDSLTRMAMAEREIGLSAGEPPTTKGYTPSCFGLIPKLLERGGTKKDSGSITILTTVLIESDDINDPIGDAARSVLDGHIVLSRDLASKNHYPAIDVLGSLSRCMNDIVDDKHKKSASRLRDLLATYKDAEDMININAYHQGSNPKIDEAIRYHDRIIHFLRQSIGDSAEFEKTVHLLEDSVT